MVSKVVSGESGKRLKMKIFYKTFPNSCPILNTGNKYRHMGENDEKRD